MQFNFSFWLWIGPLSMLMLMFVTGFLNHQAWGGLTALFYGAPIVAVIHLVACLVIVHRCYQRYQRKQKLGKSLWLSLLYYLALPSSLLLLSIYLQGFSQTLMMLKGFFQEVHFQIQHYKLSR